LARLLLHGVRKTFERTEVLHGIDLAVEDGEFAVFVGPSGCGKSTLLRLVCGLDEVTAGTIAIGDEVVNDVPPAKRGIAMVFQSYALYPHMSVAQNMGYALRLANTPREEIARRVAQAAEVLRLTPLLQRKPRQLSGGQRQRVAIGRAIVREPRMFLFDEPLSNLDAALRVEMRGEIARLKMRLGTTMIYVTHDQTEAMTLADRIVVMNAGRVEQQGAPLDLYRAPASRFVATFIGSPRMNLLPAGLAASAGLPVPPEAAEIGVRAEHLALVSANESVLAGTIALVEHLGADVFAHVAVPGMELPVVVRLPGSRAVARGQAVALAPDPGQLHAFAADGRRIAP
jgi:multiple sugar transport system ATP-binding protein